MTEVTYSLWQPTWASLKWDFDSNFPWQAFPPSLDQSVFWTSRLSSKHGIWMAHAKLDYKIHFELIEKDVFPESSFLWLFKKRNERVRPRFFFPKSPLQSGFRLFWCEECLERFKSRKKITIQVICIGDNWPFNFGYLCGSWGILQDSSYVRSRYKENQAPVESRSGSDSLSQAREKMKFISPVGTCWHGSFIIDSINRAIVKYFRRIFSFKNKCFVNIPQDWGDR